MWAFKRIATVFTVTSLLNLITLQSNSEIFVTSPRLSMMSPALPGLAVDCMQYICSASCTLGCALFSKFLGLNAVLVELDELSSGVLSFLKSDHGKLLRIAILCLVTWVSRGTCVMVS